MCVFIYIYIYLFIYLIYLFIIYLFRLREGGSGLVSAQFGLGDFDGIEGIYTSCYDIGGLI